MSSLSQAITVPHELGHNLSLGHTPGCGAENVEDLYPYPNGRRAGVWRIDRVAGSTEPPSADDSDGIPIL